ncbi:MAG: GNAT family N-acetyltransferase [Patescibacteria group bacterium]|nr:GNAT family N-acetyltransferase [Patescibacteria group bacterium]
MKIIDFKKNEKFLKQYVSLRNKYANLLLTKKVTLKETKNWIKKAAVEIRGLVQNQELLGVVILYLDKNKEITIFVKKPGRGLGERLLLPIERVARAKKCHTVWARVLTNNIPAQKFFEKYGYKKRKVTGKNFQGKIYRSLIYTKKL